MSCTCEPSAKTTKYSDKHCCSLLPAAFPSKHSLCDSAGRLRACFWEGRTSTRAAVHIWFGLAPSAPTAHTANLSEVAALQHSSRPGVCPGVDPRGYKSKELPCNQPNCCSLCHLWCGTTKDHSHTLISSQRQPQTFHTHPAHPVAAPCALRDSLPSSPLPFLPSLLPPKTGIAQHFGQESNSPN